MSTILVAGPFAKADADATADALGRANHSAVGFCRKDADGYNTDVVDWFVERDLDASSPTIFGYDAKEFMARQYRRKP